MATGRQKERQRSRSNPAKDKHNVRADVAPNEALARSARESVLVQWPTRMSSQRLCSSAEVAVGAQYPR